MGVKPEISKKVPVKRGEKIVIFSLAVHRQSTGRALEPIYRATDRTRLRGTVCNTG